MRVIHFADLHIGVETYGRPLAERGWSSRMQDFLDALDALVAFALEEGVDAVIFAGDAYKAREPSQTHQREFATRIRGLSEAGIATFLLVGNHDLPNAEGKAHALEIFRTLDVPNVTVADNDWFARNGFVAPVLQTRAGPLQVPFLPWPQVSKLLAVDRDVTNMTIEQVHAQVEQKMSELIRMQAEALDPGVPAVLACHVSMNDWLVRERAGSEQWMTVGTAPTLLKSELHDGFFDYIALGHHHNNMQLELRTPTWYSGSMQPVDFGEEKQPKGFMVFDIDPKAALGARIGGSGLPRLQQVHTRRFVTIEVSPRDSDPTAEVCRAVESAAVKDAIVRVHVKMSQDQQASFRAPEVRGMLDEAHYVAGVHVELPDERRSGLPAGVQPDAASPIEVLDTYFKVKNTEEARRTRLLTVARDLIAGVEAANA